MKKKILIGFIVTVLILAAGAAALYFGGFLPPFVKLKSDQVEADKNIEPMDLITVTNHRELYEVVNVVADDEQEPDYSVVGTYNVKYNVLLRDRVIREYDYEINVIDTTPPVITCEDAIKIPQGQSFDVNRYAKATDNATGKITLGLDGKYDKNKTGNYEVTVTAVDQSENKAEKKITLIVVENEQEATSSALTNTEKSLLGYWVNKKKDMLIQIANDGSNSKTKMKIVFSYLSDLASGADAGGRISYIEPVGTNQYKLVYSDYSTGKKESITVSMTPGTMQVKSNYSTVNGNYKKWSKKQVSKYRKK